MINIEARYNKDDTVQMVARLFTAKDIQIGRYVWPKTPQSFWLDEQVIGATLTDNEAKKFANSIKNKFQSERNEKIKVTT